MKAAQLWLDEPPTWFRVDKFSERASTMYDRHYSRQTVGSDQCLAPGRTLLMLTGDESAVWGAVHNMEPGHTDGRKQWRNAIFRREGGQQASELIIAATLLTFGYWIRTYGGLPAEPFTSEVDKDLTRPKRDPGRCYRRAGWELWSKRSRYLFIAPGERARVGLQGPVLK